MPKLNLRDLFWLVLVAAMGCGWWIEHRRQAAEIERLEAEVKSVTNDPWRAIRSYEGGCHGCLDEFLGSENKR